jgi:hypothetical protein
MKGGGLALVWAVLAAATLLSWWFGAGGGRFAAAAVVAVAFLKVRLIGNHFMEVRSAPLALRAVFEAYCISVCAMILVFYYLG